MSVVDCDLSITRSTRKAFVISLFLHVLSISFFVLSALSEPTPRPIPQRIAVQSIALLPAPRLRHAVTASPPKIASRSGPMPTPQPEVVQEEAPPAAREEPPPEPKKESAPPPQAAPTKNPSSIPRTQTSTTTVRTSVSSKAQPSSTQKATTASAHGKKTSVKSTKGSPSYDQKLLSETLHRLDTSRMAAEQASGGGKGSGHVAHVRAVGTLHVEQGLVASDESQDAAFEGYSSASPEACYIGDLIRRLQLNIRLPEPGEVRVKLTLTRAGAVSRVQVVSGKNAAVKRSIEEKLRTIHFSPFGSSFPGESDHTFALRLSNELVWSCS